MAISQMRVTRIKEARGHVLMALYTSNGLEVPLKTGWIVDAFRTMPEISREIPGEIGYMAEKGYIEIVRRAETPELQPTSAIYIRLTARGKDLVEGSVAEDPAVIFGDGVRG